MNLKGQLVPDLQTTDTGRSGWRAAPRSRSGSSSRSPAPSTSRQRYGSGSSSRAWEETVWLSSSWLERARTTAASTFLSVAEARVRRLEAPRRSGAAHGSPPPTLQIEQSEARVRLEEAPNARRQGTAPPR